MIKYFLSAIALVVITTTSFGQTTKTKLDQVKSDPKTTENAAKADVQLTRQKTVSDSLATREILMKRKQQLSRRKRNLLRKSS